MEKKGRLKNKIKNFGIGNNEDSEKKKKKWENYVIGSGTWIQGIICRICARDAK